MAVFGPTLLLSLIAFESQSPGKEVGSLSAANAQFCSDVFKEMSSDHITENAFSPLRLLSSPAVVLFGTRGHSAFQIERERHTLVVVPGRQARDGFKPLLLRRFHGHQL